MTVAAAWMAGKQLQYRDLTADNGRASGARSDLRLYSRAQDMAVYARLRRGGRIIFQTGDHPPPHFHADFGDDEATFYIDTGKMKEGYLPPQDHREVNRWYRRDRKADVDRLMEAWHEYA